MKILSPDIFVCTAVSIYSDLIRSTSHVLRHWIHFTPFYVDRMIGKSGAHCQIAKQKIKSSNFLNQRPLRCTWYVARTTKNYPFIAYKLLLNSKLDLSVWERSVKH